MIKDSIDFDYAVKKITTFLEPKMQYQGEFLESTKLNETFKELEATLNSLYEKTRYLEDSIVYARTFLDTKIKNFNDEMDSIIKELESTVNTSKNLSYLSYNVPLKPNDIYINDRSSAQDKIAPLIIKDKVLTLGYENDTDIEYSSVYAISDSISFDNNLNDIIKTKEYKTIYLEEKAIKDGLIETIVVYFASPKTINVLDFVASNCNIKNIRFGLINGIEEFADDYVISTNNVARTCTYIKFDLVCTNYNTIIYEIDKSKITNNLWNDLKAFEAAKTTNLGNVSKLNAEYIISRTTTNKLTGETSKENLQSKANKETVAIIMYSYIFGLDRLNFKNVKFQTSGYFISDYINLGRMASIEYITLHVSDSKDQNCAIEYSILDGNKEIPIMPVGVKLVENEPIINGEELRFIKNTNKNDKNYVEDIIKKDGQSTSISYNDAINMTDGQYSITYKPFYDNYEIKGIVNESIRIKCYIRTYGPMQSNKPFIELITVRKYGEDSLWINRY